MSRKLSAKIERLRASGGSSQSDRNKDSNPFTHSSHGNPAFTPQKVTKGSNIVSKRNEEWSIPTKKRCKAQKTIIKNGFALFFSFVNSI